MVRRQSNWWSKASRRRYFKERHCAMHQRVHLLSPQGQKLCLCRPQTGRRENNVDSYCWSIYLIPLSQFILSGQYLATLLTFLADYYNKYAILQFHLFTSIGLMFISGGGRLSPQPLMPSGSRLTSSNFLPTSCL